MKIFNIAIDGPSGSGKSTVAGLVAKELGFFHLNTGSLYRALALEVIKHGDIKDENEILNILKSVSLEIAFVDNRQVTSINGRAVDGLLREERIGMVASYISSFQGVRDIVNCAIKKCAKNNSLVVEGRDIGSVVFADSPYKFYLDASSEIRAKRRFVEINKTKPYEEILTDLVKRDNQDKTRQVAPLIRCDDAIYIDTSNMAIKEVVDRITKHIK